MSRPDGPLLVLGVGNILLRDEGVGVRVARELERQLVALDREPAPGIRIVDGGTLGLDLLPMVEDSAALLIVDAVDVGRPPGSVAVLRGDAIQGALAGHLSPHQVGVGDLVVAARLTGVLPAAVSLVGIQPDVIEIGLDLSDAVAAALPHAVAVARAEIARLALATTSVPA